MSKKKIIKVNKRVSKTCNNIYENLQNFFLNKRLKSNCPVVGHLTYRSDTKTRHVRRKMASAFFLSPKISAFHDTRRCRTLVNRLIIYPTSLVGLHAWILLAVFKLFLFKMYNYERFECNV
jgi:hypothetical protein